MNWIHGTAYYPEVWDRKVWENDIKHLKHLGINTVRMGEFAWSTMEPKPDEFHFEIFDEVIELLNKNGISVIMCTPSPTPPIWISDGHPERMYYDGGTPITHGGRQHVCTNNPYFRERVKIIVTEMAKHFADNKAIIAWQIDNELKCNVGECFCEECGVQWHKWLEERYKTIENLNKAWGTDVWSQAYQNFDQVPQALRVPAMHNPSLSTNYSIFSADKVNEFLRLQTDILREYTNAPITHNGCPHFSVNNDSMAEHLDFVAYDAYPSAEDYREFLFDCRRFRGLKESGQFMCLETSPGYNGCTVGYDKVHPDGYVKAEATGIFALGGIGISYWHFHQHYAGCEITHGSLLSADGRPNALCYPQVEGVRDRIAEMKPILNGYKRTQPQIAVQADDTAKLFIRTEHYNGMYYNALLREYNDVLMDNNYSFDIVTNDLNVQNYSVVFTPFQFALSDEHIEKMIKFCEQGGVWVVGPMTCIRTTEHTVNKESGLPLKIEKALGVENTAITPNFGSKYTVTYNGEQDNMRYFTVSGHAVTAKSLGMVENLKDRGAAFTCNSIGKGKAILFGAMPESGEMFKKLILRCLDEAQVKPSAEATADIVTVPYTSEDKDMIFGFDMGGKGGTFTAFGETKEITPYGIAAIEKNRY